MTQSLPSTVYRLPSTVHLSSGIRLVIKPVSGIILQRAQADVPEPEVPRFYIQEQDRWVDNPHHPDYATALQDAAQRRAEVALQALIRQSCQVVGGIPEDDRWLRLIRRYKEEDTLLASLDLEDEDDYRFYYILREGIRESEDVDKIVEASCLCEEAVKSFIRTIGVTRNGAPIDEAGLRHSLSTGIDGRALAIGRHLLVSPTDEYAACTGSGLSWWQWRNSGFDLEFMVETVACYRVRKLVETHVSDAQQSESEKKAKKR